MARLTLILTLLPGIALAHPGHGVEAPHDHGILLVLALAVIAALVAFRIRRR